MSELYKWNKSGMKMIIESGFKELLLCNLSYEYGLTFDLKVDNKIYAITPFALDECLEVYDCKAEENIYGIWGSDDESVIEQIREKLEEEK